MNISILTNIDNVSCGLIADDYYGFMCEVLLDNLRHSDNSGVNYSSLYISFIQPPPPPLKHCKLAIFIY